MHAAPLLCAGAIGYRSLRLAELNNGDPIGMTGFGASAHLMLKMLQGEYPDSRIYVFARKPEEREFALSLGADWAGNTDESPPERLMAIVDTTPAWFPVTQALRFLAPGGRLVINAIRKEAGDREVLSELDYETQLWMEKEIKSVANVARRDVQEFLAPRQPLGDSTRLSTLFPGRSESGPAGPTLRQYTWRQGIETVILGA